MATSVRLDNQCFLHVFICFSVTSLIATAIMVYYISQILDFPSKNNGKLWASGTGDAQQEAHIRSRDPMVMQGLAGVRAGRKPGTVESLTLTQVNFNDSCFSFVWTRLHSQIARKYKVLITNLQVPTMVAIWAVTGERDVQFVQCGLNVSTPYLVNLTAIGEDVEGAWETASRVMWTTHQVPLPPGLPRIISVTETTVTVTLPSVTLTHGPLTAIEIRIKQTDGFLEEAKSHPVFWTSFFKRHKRSSESLHPGGVLARTVDIPDSWLQSVYKHDNMEDSRRDDVLLKVNRLPGSLMHWQTQRSFDLRNANTGVPNTVIPNTGVPNTVIPNTDVPTTVIPNTDVPTTVIPNTDVPNTVVPHTAVPNTDVPNTVVSNTVVPNTVTPNTDVPNTVVPNTVLPHTVVLNTVVPNKDFPYTAVLNKDGVESEGRNGEHVLTHNQQQRKKSKPSGFHTNSERRFVDSRGYQGNLAIAHFQQLTATANAKLEDATLSTVSYQLQSLGRQATSGDLMESKTVNNGQVIVNITSSPLHDNGDISQHERLASTQRYHGSDVTGPDPDLGVVYEMSRRHVTSSLFQPASPGEDMALLLQLARDIEQLLHGDILSDTSSLDVLHASSLQPGTVSDTSSLDVLHASSLQPGTVSDTSSLDVLLASSLQPGTVSDTSSLDVPQASSFHPGIVSNTSSQGVLQASFFADDMQGQRNISIACHKCQGLGDILSDDIKAGPAPPLSPRSTRRNLPGLASNTKTFPREVLAAASRPLVSRWLGKSTTAVPRRPLVSRWLGKSTTAVPRRPLVSRWLGKATTAVPRRPLVSRWLGKATTAVPRRKRSLLGFGRQPRRQLIAADVREVEDRLAVDPYLTLDVLESRTEQPIRVKTGCGYFLTDHYGVRHPYFNNSLLEQGLRRYAHYQEAKDFVLYSKSLLNLTQFQDLDGQLLYARLTKVMDANRRRRIKLFLDMFEDFLFWNQDKGNNQLGGTAVPLEAKLGLPPGLPVARVMEAGVQNVTIGDDLGHGRLPNPALQPGTEYEVVIVVLSTVVDVSKHSWISVNITTLPEQPKMVSDAVLLIVGATATVGLLVFLLAQVIIWCTTSVNSLGAVSADV